MLACAYANIRGRNDYGRAFKMEPKSVGQSRYVIAHVVESNETEFVRRLSSSFRSGVAPSIFVSSMASDSTMERFELPLHPVMLSHITRSAWKCLRLHPAICMELAGPGVRSDIHLFLKLLENVDVKA